MSTPPQPVNLTPLNHGGKATSPPLLLTWGPGSSRTELFHLGTNLCLYHQWRDGASSAPFRPSAASWEKLGVTPHASITGVSWGPQRVDVFGVGADGNTLDHKWYVGDRDKWRDWETLRPDSSIVDDKGNKEGVPRVLGEIAAAVYDVGSVLVFWRGAESALHFAHWREADRKWFQVRWTPDAMAFVGSPRAVVSMDGDRKRCDVFCRVAGGRVMHSHWYDGEAGPLGASTGHWPAWQDVGGAGFIADDPEVVRWTTYSNGSAVVNFNLLARDAAGNVVRKRWSSLDKEGQWTPALVWELTGLQALTPPGAVAWNSNADSNITVAALDTNNRLRVAQQDALANWGGEGIWKTFEVEGATPFTHKPALHPDGGPLNEKNPLEIFLRAQDGSLKQVLVQWKDMR